MDKTLGNIFKGDKVIWMVFFFLCIISVIEVYSASAGLTYKGGHYWAPIVKHTGILLVGVFAMVVTLNIKCKYFKIVTPFLLLIAVVTLITVLLAGQSTNGAQRWISIVGIQFQPSEIAKGALVLATAQILSAMQTEHGADKNAFKYILIVSAFIIPLIMVENLSTAMLLCMVIFMMMIIGRVPGKILGKALGVVTLLILTIFTLVMVVGKDHEKENANPNHIEQVAVAEQKKDPSMFGSVFHRFDTWKGRIDRFIAGKETSPEEFDLDKDAQIGHANIAIVSSNFIGKGPGNSVERDFLSQAFSDFIYAIIIEEMGIFGGFFVAMLYIILLFRTGRIANRCENNFPAFLAMGLALLLVTQALFNMCVAVGLAPVTGQPLPLVSKGGTSTIINCVYIGAILSVSRSAKKKADADSEEVMSEKLATA
ncbi:FtsW/RodA/SpoVE family cell cycle protein [Hoylesella buccalis]|uniref:FtsW/RodA/SpoVE family cell cycle protein n=1 Tax=Hoylesella buccalis TaxID=28127 RepID=UPI001D06AF21|nr:FtsW/RodA/SpoVE family cell cycle protein [Hoylesella buccalis]MCB6901383.1 FtsW/RodA/SpoVE family cell cycle protein [Hoylesella buccalis]UEA61844.1 FtsW/RodA/SpoVE family cell cycle protein [Hoylesella buccalis]UWP48438.1 FtsW/RodA/SpoVE family cell cycle protein [Hoylesella buccalis ATCC 35310]